MWPHMFGGHTELLIIGGTSLSTQWNINEILEPHEMRFVPFIGENLIFMHES